MTTPIKGFDVSKWQNPAAVPWAELKRLGYQWCYIRAAYGLTPDPRFAAHVAQAEAHGIEWGAYLYLRDDDTDAMEQAVEMWSTLRGHPVLGGGFDRQLQPCLDIEEQDPSPEYLEGVKAAAEFLRDVAGNCAIYTGAVYRVVHGLRDWCDEYPQWIADYDGPIYGFQNELLPEAHQHTGKGIVAGYGPLDLNVAYDLDAFRIEPRGKVELAPPGRVELLCEVRNLANAIRDTSGEARLRYVRELLDTAEHLYDVIEQDAGAERQRNEEYAAWGTAERGGS